ncbi:MAG: DUF2911 domain-containing protein [Imperialibacter sp.]|jgi:hypothetical protein|uniref:DUF2911 domain-containing protein n=1 Tax=Imperialibacter sp. TaxID=2038411 RepID=UPI003A87D43D
MRKKILIGVGVVVVLLAAAMFYMNNRNRTLSPAGSAELTNAGVKVSLTYSRPSVRDRVIFGTEEEGALQPYGVYWRLGANESTEVTVDSDVSINGKPLKKGTYKVYAVPGPESFEVIFNTELGNWGYSEADHELDVLSTTVPVVTDGSVTEQHTITLSPADGGVDVNVAFEKVKFTVPIKSN